MLSHVFLRSFPNFLTIFLGIGLFCSLYPRREKLLGRLAVVLAACLALSGVSAAAHRILVPQLEESMGLFVAGMPTFAIFIATILVSIPIARFVFEMGTWDAVFCVTAGYALQNFSHTVWELALTFLPSSVTLPQALSALTQVGVSLVVFSVGYVCLILPIRANHLEGEGDARTIFVLVCVIMVNVLLDNVVGSLLSSGSVERDIYTVMRLSQLFASALMLALDYEILFSNRARESMAATRQMMDDERRQYELSRDTIEAINLRCHDIRHQVRQYQGATESGRAYLEGISELISVYDSNVQTSNKALDVILTEKSMVCQSRGIGLTCNVDGQSLAFMEEQDVYSLFGNALDNAIEAVGHVADEERRLIDVTARQIGQMACVQVRNFFDGDLNLEDGQLKTTKTDGGLHGYGTKSLRLIAERYGGTLHFETEGRMFRLRMVLPLPLR